MALLILFVGLLGLYSASACRVPPSFWCDSLEIARDCKVEDQCWENRWSKLQSGEAERVQLGLYYESLCPDCRLFISSQLYPAWLILSDIVNVTLVPYGNTHEKPAGNKWKFKCQHGPQECLGDIIETCTIHFLKDIKAYFPVIHCMENSTAHIVDAFKQCTKNVSQASDIMACSQSDLGNQLEHEMGLKTESLSPKHYYTPWITLNGVHTENIQKEAENDLKKLICDTYTGVKPDACKQGRKKVCLKEL